MIFFVCVFIQNIRTVVIMIVSEAQMLVGYYNMHLGFINISLYIYIYKYVESRYVGMDIWKVRAQDRSNN